LSSGPVSGRWYHLGHGYPSLSILVCKIASPHVHPEIRLILVPCAVYLVEAVYWTYGYQVSVQLPPPPMLACYDFSRRSFAFVSPWCCFNRLKLNFSCLDRPPCPMVYCFSFKFPPPPCLNPTMSGVHSDIGFFQINFCFPVSNSPFLNMAWVSFSYPTPAFPLLLLCLLEAPILLFSHSCSYTVILRLFFQFISVLCLSFLRLLCGFSYSSTMSSV